MTVTSEGTVDQRARAAIDDIRRSDTLSVLEAAVQHRVSMSVIYKKWQALYPGTVPRGTGCAQTRKFEETCERVRGLIGTDDMAIADLIVEVKGKMSAMTDRRIYRVLKKLLEDGKIQRTGGRAHAYYRRVP